MLFKNFLIASFCIALLSVLTASPVQDISKTSVSVDEILTSSTSERLSVNVQRVDDLVDDDGSLLAMRIMNVVLNFDVNDDQILLNNVPVELGLSSMEVEAALIVNESKPKVENIEKAFDIGLIKANVFAHVETIAVDEESGLELRRITVQEQIIEINGEAVVQTDIMEQVLEIHPNGNVMKYSPTNYSTMPGIALVQGNAFAQHDDSSKPIHCMSSLRWKNWWHNLPLLARVSLFAFVSASVCVLLFIIFPMVAFSRVFKRRNQSGSGSDLAGSYEPVKAYQEIVEEKMAVANSLADDIKPPAYPYGYVVASAQDNESKQ